MIKPVRPAMGPEIAETAMVRGAPYAKTENAINVRERGE